MPGTPTTRLALPTISGATDAVSSYPSVNLSQMTTLDNAVTFSSGTLAARPAAAVNGRIYEATDVSGGTYYLDTGAAWQTIPMLGGPYGPLQVAVTSTSVTAAAGQQVIASASCTVTLPLSPIAGARVGVLVGYGASGASAVTVTRGGTPTIYGAGLNAATTFTLGAEGAAVILQFDGANWGIVAGQQDTGWVTISNTFYPGAITSGNLAYRQIGDRVWLSGELTGTLTGTTTVLSAGNPLQPSSSRFLPVVTLVGSTPTPAGATIQSGGGPTTVSVTSASTAVYFDDVSYRIS